MTVPPHWRKPDSTGTDLELLLSPESWLPDGYMVPLYWKALNVIYLQWKTSEKRVKLEENWALAQQN